MPDCPPAVPRLLRVLDAAAVMAALVSVNVFSTGGFREWTPFGRLSMTSWVRPLVIAAVLVAVRHWWQPRPHLLARASAGLTRAWRAPGVREALPLVLSTRAAVLLAGFLAIALFGYRPNVPVPWRIYDNEIWNLPARWDTGWYLGVAIEGYTWNPSRPTEQQNIAFFPVYPMLMRYGSLFLGRETMWTGVLIAWLSFLGALVYLFRLAREQLGEDGAAFGIALLACYPFALFFSTAYTEALFLLTVAGACYHFERRELWRAAIWGLLAGLTRPNGCLLSIVLGLMALRPFWPQRPLAALAGEAASALPPREGRLADARRAGPRAARAGGEWRPTFPPEGGWARFADLLAVAAAPGIGMLIYSTYIYFLTGNPLQWAEQNAAWGRVYRGIDVLVSQQAQRIGEHGLYTFAATRTLDALQLAAVLFVLATVVPVARRLGLPYAALILVNLITPLLMGGLLSMGRVTSVLFPAFLWLGVAIPVRHRAAWLAVFATLQAICAAVFFTWRPLY
jgi:hypothetical protein